MAATSGAAALHDNVAGLFDAIRSRAGVDGAMTFAQAAQAVASIQGGADVVALDMSGGALGQAEGLSEVGAGVYAAPASFTLGVPQPPASMEGATFAGWLVEGAAEGAQAGGSPLSDGLLPASGPVEFSGLSDGAARLTAVWVRLAVGDKVYDGAGLAAAALCEPHSVFGDPELAYFPVYDGSRSAYGVRSASVPGDYAVVATWACAAGTVSAEAGATVSKAPVTLGIEVRRDGALLEEGATVRYGDGTAAALTAEGLAAGDDPGMLAYIEDYVPIVGLGPYAARYRARLRVDYDARRLYSFPVDPGDESAGEYGYHDVVAEFAYSYAGKDVCSGDVVPVGQERMDYYHSRCYLRDAATGRDLCDGYEVSVSYLSADEVPLGAAGSHAFEERGYVPGEALEGYPSDGGVYFAQVAGSNRHANWRSLYTGERLVPFRVGGTDASSLDVSLSEHSAVFDGTAHAPEVSVSIGGTELEEGPAWEHYWVCPGSNASGPPFVNYGTRYAHVRLAGAYRGDVKLRFDVSPAALDSFAVEAAGAFRLGGALAALPKVTATLANAEGSYLLTADDYRVVGYSASESGPFHADLESFNAALDGSPVGSTAYVKISTELSTTYNFEFGTRVVAFDVVDQMDITGYTARLYDPDTGDELTRTANGYYQMQLTAKGEEHEPAVRVFDASGAEVPAGFLAVSYDNNYRATTEKNPSTATATGAEGSPVIGSVSVSFVIKKTLYVAA